LGNKRNSQPTEKKKTLWPDPVHGPKLGGRPKVWGGGVHLKEAKKKPNGRKKTRQVAGKGACGGEP